MSAAETADVGDGNVETPVEAQQAETPAEASPEATQSEAETFYDATKVPDELRPTFSEMQKSYTQKTQEIAELKSALSEYGELDEVRGFLDQFKTSEGVLSWWGQIARQLGLSEQQLAQMLQGEDTSQRSAKLGEVTDDDSDNKYLSRDEFQQQMQEMQSQQKVQEDLKQIESIYDSMEVPKEARDYVTYLASQHPLHMGYKARIEKGWKEYQDLLDQQVSQTLSSREKANKSPKSISGQTPTPSGEKPKSLDDARRMAKQFMESASDE